jgi:hypothetical protein
MKLKGEPGLFLQVSPFWNQRPFFLISLTICSDSCKRRVMKYLGFIKALIYSVFLHGDIVGTGLKLPFAGNTLKRAEES